MRHTPVQESAVLENATSFEPFPDDAADDGCVDTILRLATAVSGVAAAMRWYRDQPLALLEWHTPRELVVMGRGEAVVAFLADVVAVERAIPVAR